MLPHRRSLQLQLCSKGDVIKVKVGVYLSFNSKGNIVTGPHYCHLWETKPH